MKLVAWVIIGIWECFVVLEEWFDRLSLNTFPVKKKTSSLA